MTSFPDLSLSMKTSSILEILSEVVYPRIRAIVDNDDNLSEDSLVFFYRLSGNSGDYI